MKRLSPSQQKIVDYLADGAWHCMANATFFMKDDRTRISELNRLGYEIIGSKCDQRCKVAHSSAIVMRKLVTRPVVKEPHFIERDGVRIAVIS